MLVYSTVKGGLTALLWPTTLDTEPRCPTVIRSARCASSASVSCTDRRLVLDSLIPRMRPVKSFTQSVLKITVGESHRPKRRLLGSESCACETFSLRSNKMRT